MRKKWLIGVLVFAVGGGLFEQAGARSPEVEVGQVVVTATKTEVDLSDVPQSMSVITREEILRSPDQTVAEILHRVAGVEVGLSGPRGSVANPRIRGSEPAQVLVMLNGRRINDAQLTLFDLSSLPVTKEEIERIEVLRGSASALYGTDAMGGVINIITKSPAKTPTTRVSASLGRFDTQDHSLVHQWKPGAFSYGISAARERSSGFRQNSDYENWILGGEVGYELGSHSEVKFSARSIRKEIGVPGPTNFPLDPDDRQKDHNTLLDLSYQGKLSPDLNLSVKGFQNIYRMIFDPGSQGTFSFGPPFLHKNYTTGGDLSASYAFGSRHLFTGGTEVIQDRVNSSNLGIHRATRGAFYLQDEIEIARPVAATLGFRYDMHSSYQEQFNPRAGLLFRLPADVRVRTSVARSFRAPTFNDLFWPDGGFTVGNPNLSPEKAWSYELGAEKKFDDKAVFKVAGFYRRVKDLIIWQPDENFVFSPRNINSAKIWGTEAELSLYPLKNLTIPLNYSFTYPRDDGTGDPIPLRPRHIFNVGVDYATSFGLKGGLYGRYTQYYRDQKTTLNKDYFVIDARLAYGFKVYREFQGEAFLSLHNALDRQYQVTPDFPMPPRSLSGGVSFNF